MSGREQQADQYAWTHGDSQTRADFLAGWDAAVRAGVVAEEPEGEYGFNWVDHAYQEPHALALGQGETALRWAERISEEIGGVELFRRTASSKPGEWVPVKQEGTET